MKTTEFHIHWLLSSLTPTHFPQHTPEWQSPSICPVKSLSWKWKFSLHHHIISTDEPSGTSINLHKIKISEKIRVLFKLTKTWLIWVVHNLQSSRALVLLYKTRQWCSPGEHSPSSCILFFPSCITHTHKGKISAVPATQKQPVTARLPSFKQNLGSTNFTKKRHFLGWFFCYRSVVWILSKSTLHKGCYVMLRC